MASYDSNMVKDTELFSMTHSTASVCLWRLHGCVLDFVAMGVAETPELNN